jgi:hypothetical protein
MIITDYLLKFCHVLLKNNLLPSEKHIISIKLLTIKIILSFGSINYMLKLLENTLKTVPFSLKPNIKIKEMLLNRLSTNWKIKSTIILSKDILTSSNLKF